ncbi:hypothetical protein GN958_ATG21821 [Phytophthora infestans]|nr:hypothetical protein GN958_ATG21821 [Phytophthora infestans]
MAMVVASESLAAAHQDLTASTKELKESSRNLLSQDSDSLTKRSISRELSATEDERLETITRALSTNAVTTKNADGTITNSTYYNNGLVQRVQKWWDGLFHAKSTRRLRKM